jgi:hypothetical protein
MGVGKLVLVLAVEPVGVEGFAECLRWGKTQLVIAPTLLKLFLAL